MRSHQDNLYKIATVFVFLLAVGFARSQIEMECNPSLRHRYDICPPNYCCVRDEYLRSYVYCKRIGREGDNCSSDEMESACPCGDGLYCQSNIVGEFLSVYGKCATS